MSNPDTGPAHRQESPWSGTQTLDHDTNPINDIIPSENPEKDRKGMIVYYLKPGAADDIRQIAGMSEEQIGAEVGIARIRLSKKEAGQGSSGRYAWAIARFYAERTGLKEEIALDRLFTKTRVQKGVKTTPEREPTPRTPVYELTDEGKLLLIEWEKQTGLNETQFAAKINHSAHNYREKIAGRKATREPFAKKLVAHYCLEHRDMGKSEDEVFDIIFRQVPYQNNRREASEVPDAVKTKIEKEARASQEKKPSQRTPVYELTDEGKILIIEWERRTGLSETQFAAKIGHSAHDYRAKIANRKATREPFARNIASLYCSENPEEGRSLDEVFEAMFKQVPYKNRAKNTTQNVVA